MAREHISKRKTDSICLGGREVEFCLVPSRSAKRLRVRVGIDGVDVVHPANRTREDVTKFLETHAAWVVEQLKRIEQLRGIRRPREHTTGNILLRGEPVAIQVREEPTRSGPNRVFEEAGRLTILQSPTSKTAPVRTLENWLRKQARAAIDLHLSSVTAKLRRQPGRVLIMGQRTKWGNCSTLQNLSFNWRLIMAPESVLRYIVTHEAVHLAIPDHSQKFWLTVRSICPEAERAKQWLCTSGDRLMVELEDVCRCIAV